jgi:BlaI family transcriptional regulator, penicillinase repressor
MPGKPPVSDTELDVLKVLWATGSGTVREVEAQLRRRKRRWAYNTVLTLLTRLRDKGYVTTDRSGAAHIFRPVVTRDDLLSQGLARLADRICDGTASPLVHALVRDGRLSADDIARLRRLLDDLESGD